MIRILLRAALPVAVVVWALAVLGYAPALWFFNRAGLPLWAPPQFWWLFDFFAERGWLVGVLLFFTLMFGQEGSADEVCGSDR